MSETIIKTEKMTCVALDHYRRSTKRGTFTSSLVFKVVTYITYVFVFMRQVGLRQPEGWSGPVVKSYLAT